MTPEQISAGLKAKYPQYKDVPDEVLLPMFFEKHPDGATYKKQLVQPSNAQETSQVPEDDFLRRQVPAKLATSTNLIAQGAGKILSNLPYQDYSKEPTKDEVIDTVMNVTPMGMGTIIGKGAKNWARVKVPAQLDALEQFKFKEISDVPTIIKKVEENGNDIPLHALLGYEGTQVHPIFKSYPDLKNWKVRFNSNGYTTTDLKSKTFFIDRTEQRGRTIKSQLLHEITHPIQAYEGWQSGGMPEDFKSIIPNEKQAFKAYEALSGEWHANQTVKRQQVSQKGLNNFPRKMSTDTNEDAFLANKVHTVAFGKEQNIKGSIVQRSELELHLLDLLKKNLPTKGKALQALAAKDPVQAVKAGLPVTDWPKVDRWMNELKNLGHEGPELEAMVKTKAKMLIDEVNGVPGLEAPSSLSSNATQSKQGQIVPAVRDPKTGQVYTGPSHSEIMTSVIDPNAKRVVMREVDKARYGKSQIGEVPKQLSPTQEKTQFNKEMLIRPSPSGEKTWGTRNKWYYENPNEPGSVPGDLWELEQVIQGKKPALLTNHIEPSKLKQVAEANGLVRGRYKSGSLVVAKDQKTLDRVLQAKNGRDLGLALGYEDLTGLGPSDLPNADPFYSKLQKVLEEQKIPENMPSQGLINTLLKQQVKPDEIKWSGLDKFLEGKSRVTKAEVQQYLKENDFKVNEIEKSDVPTRTAKEYEVTNANGEVINTFRTEDEATAYIDELIDTSDKDISGYTVAKPGTPDIDRKTQYGPDTHPDLQIPGATRHEETLYQLPIKEGKAPFSEQQIKFKMDEWGGTREEAIKEMQRLGSVKMEEPGFQGGHYDEPNVLAHVLRDEIKIGKDKVSLLNEKQSDWHQQGGMEGYKGIATKLPEGYKVVSADKVGKNPGMYVVVDKNNLPISSPKSNGMSDSKEGAEQIGLDILNAGEVPDAPFKKNWNLLIDKREIRRAVERKQDGLAWPDGSVIAKRYSLSNWVSEVDYVHKPNNTFDYTVYRKNGDRWKSYEGHTLDQVRAHLGKDTAEKMKSAQGNVAIPRTSIIKKGPESVYHNGIVLPIEKEIGGEWHKKMYDEKFVNDLNAFVKSFGAKMEKVQYVSPKMQALDTLQKQDLNMYLSGALKGKGGNFEDVALELKEQYGFILNEQKYNSWVNSVTSRSPRVNFEAFKRIENEISDARKGSSQIPMWYLKFTPALKRAALKEGFPLFIGLGAVGLTQEQQK